MSTVTELAKRAGTPAHAVRYYTRMGLLTPERDPDNGYRLYDPRCFSFRGRSSQLHEQMTNKGAKGTQNGRKRDFT